MFPDGDVLKVKWAMYTVLLGMIPIIARAFTWAVSSSSTSIQPLSATDVAGYGIVLVATNISGLEHEHRVDPAWKSRSNALSIMFAIVLALVFTVSALTEVWDGLDSRKILIGSVLLAIVATVHSYAVWDRLSRMPEVSDA
jgi:phosphatidylglycerophosphate synthase